MSFFHFIRESFQFIMQNLFHITLVTLAWLVLLFPVVTIPGATVAVFYFARQAWLQDEARFQDFITGLKRFFWKGWLIVLPYALLEFLLVCDIAYFSGSEQPATRLWASIPMAILSVLLIAQSYAFVLFVKENGALWAAVRKSFLLAASNLVFSLALLLLTLLYFLALYATKIGLAILFVGPVAIYQTRAVQQLMTRHGVEF